MPGQENLTERMEKQLPAELIEFMQAAGLVAARRGQNLYLVGGMVRDLLLGRQNLDLDLMVEGDAITLAEELTGIEDANLVTHPRFRTATIKYSKGSIDLVTARSETYPRPGALPKVSPGQLDTDLFRRDFTVNSMAVELVPSRWGEFIDLYGGQDDLKKKRIRVLHENSFKDDATRIWRAIRYEQRLGFKIEPETLRLLTTNLHMLDTISADRLRHELELVLSEEFPEKVLRRADDLGMLRKFHPSLKTDEKLGKQFREARSMMYPEQPSRELYLALLAFPLNSAAREQFITKFRLRKVQALALRDSEKLRQRLKKLSEPGIPPSRVYSLLEDISSNALAAGELAAEHKEARKHIGFYTEDMLLVEPELTGKDLQDMGITSGQTIKKVLRKLLEARLDGKVKTREDEVKIASETKK